MKKKAQLKGMQVIRSSAKYDSTNNSKLTTCHSHKTFS